VKMNGKNLTITFVMRLELDIGASMGGSNEH
jgi:hypothetical protein